MSGRRAKPFPKNFASGDWVAVSRIQAARQQLDAAAALYFISDDVISSHTLLFAAIGILNPMLQARGGADLLLADKVKPEERDAWLATMRESSNFFKHGKKEGDPNEILHFRPNLDELSLHAAILAYREIAGGITDNMTIFVWWIRRKYTQLCQPPLSETEQELAGRFSLTQKTEYYRYLRWILSPECRGESATEVKYLGEIEAELLMRASSAKAPHTSSRLTTG